MKRWLPLLVLVLFSGCSGPEDGLDRAMTLRARLLQGACSFTAEVTADYGQQVHTFTLDCRGDPQGNLSFAVTLPESIRGITGSVTGEGGMLTFAGAALQFASLADGQLSPVSAPWVLLKTLRSGYLTSAGMDGDLLLVCMDDTYADNALKLEVWLDEGDNPVRADLVYDGRRILSVTIRNFQIQSLPVG